MTPDEVAQLRDGLGASEDTTDVQPGLQPRPNVLFEAGMALGRDPERTVIVKLGKVRQFSDIAGRHVVQLRDDAASRKELAGLLAAAGCAVDMSGTDWLSAGSFGDVPGLA